MSEVSQVKVTEKGQPIDTPVIMYVNKKVFEGWEDVKITRELNSAASDFQCQLTDKWRQNQEPWKLNPGDHVHIHARGKSILTGYIDRVEASVTDESRTIKISGRSKTADLVDCSAEIGAYEGITLSALVKNICKPFGISVLFLGQDGEVKSKAVSAGETAFTLIEYLARQRKMLIYPSVEGQLILAPVGTKRAATEIRQGINFQGGSVSHDNSNRFSQYETKGQSAIAWGGTEIQGIQPSGIARDAGISRYRPLIINSENNIDDQTGGDRAQYECELRAAQALEVSVQVQGWFQPDGNLWDVNQLVSVDAGFLGIRRKLIVNRVEYNKGNGGTTCNLSLIRSDAFEFENKKTKPKEDNLGWTKALDK